MQVHQASATESFIMQTRQSVTTELDLALSFSLSSCHVVFFMQLSDLACSAEHFCLRDAVMQEGNLLSVTPEVFTL